MFEGLDDPNPPLPDHTSCAQVVGSARRRRARRHRRVAVSATGAVAVGVLGVAGFFMAEGRRLDSVAHVRVATQPATEPGVQTILVVGTDKGVYPANGSGADSIAAVRVDTGAHTASVLAIPRDLAIPDATGGAAARVSAIFRTGGPGALVTSLHDALGLDITHYVQVDPAGFAALVDATGGVRLRAWAPLRDTHSGLDLAGGTCTSLDGASALALARSRYLEAKIGGSQMNSEWMPYPPGGSDLDRMQRDSMLGRALFTALQGADLASPVGLDHLVDLFVKHVVVDSGLRRDDLVALVRAVRAVPTSGLTITWLPVTATTDSGGAASVLALTTGWRAVVSGFQSGMAPSAAVSGPNSEGSPSARPILELC